MINALAASAIALAMGVPWQHIKEGLHDYEGMKGRFKPYRLRNGVTLVDDSYNSNPYSLGAALKAIKELEPKKGRIIICLGQMSELGKETGPAHREAGACVASMAAEYLLVMGESASEVLEGALKEGFPSARAKIVSTHKEMAQEIKEIMKPHDLILLKGSRIMELEKVAHLLLENGSEEDKHG
jgi:UDP-N-acetylmuramoyl-tripeptide--D-alanyl-D-alanine ligase